jgi:hypothetical protein
MKHKKMNFLLSYKMTERKSITSKSQAEALSSDCAKLEQKIHNEQTARVFQNISIEDKQQLVCLLNRRAVFRIMEFVSKYMETNDISVVVNDRLSSNYCLTHSAEQILAEVNAWRQVDSAGLIRLNEYYINQWWKKH